MTFYALVFSLFCHPVDAPQMPQGYLDCSFDASGVYVCRP